MALPEAIPEMEMPLPMQAQQPMDDIFFRGELYKALDKLLEDGVTDERLKDFALWAGTTKTLKLTFFTDTDVFSFENLFEAEVCKYLRSLPVEKQSLATSLLIGQARFIVYANLRRSLGTAMPKLNERIAILSQWHMNTGQEMGVPKKKGILQRFLG